MGSNKSTLDYMDLITGEYRRNIFAAVNPSVPKELGDVGNDLQIYGSRLYAVINCSNKIEVMDKYTAKRIGQIDIPNCRYIQFKDGYAYVTSYAGPVEINPDYEQTGYVAKVDTATLQVIDRCLVGFQPDELEIVGEKIYVANSGGYMVPNYENTVSVIDIPSFTETKRIEVEINLHHLRADKHGNLWVTSRGDYYDIPSRLFHINTETDTYEGALDIPVAEFVLSGDSLYIIGNQWSYNSYGWTIAFGIVNVATKEIVSHNFITDGEDKKMSMPYGIEVNPVTKDIYITDAANYVYPGALYCFDKNGQKKWQVQTGDIPAHFALLYK
jgi:DNA-binding beta-propeller fold protein YncE